MRMQAMKCEAPWRSAEVEILGTGRALFFALVASATLMAQADVKPAKKAEKKKPDVTSIDWSKVRPVQEVEVEKEKKKEVAPVPAPTPSTQKAPDAPVVQAAPTASEPAQRVVEPVSVPESKIAPEPAPTPALVAAAPAPTTSSAPVPAPAPRVVQAAPAPKAELPQGVGMDLRPYAPELPPDPKHARRPWNIRPVTYYGRLDAMTFNSYTAHTDDGSTLHGTLGQHAGVGFGAALEAFPQKWGAVFITWDYRYGFASKLTLDGPALYKLGTLDLAAQHQVSIGAHAGFRAPWSGEWSIGLEYRAEGYRVSGPSGSPSTAWLQRPWARVGARWSLDVIRDLRPFIGVDIALPLTGAPSFAGADYDRDVKNLLGIYPTAPVGTAPSATSADAIARAHAAKFQVGVVYGIRFFRPRRRWRAPVVGVQELPTRPTDGKEYEIPKEAITPGQDKPKDKPKEKAPDPHDPPKKDN